MFAFICIIEAFLVGVFFLHWMIVFACSFHIIRTMMMK